MAGCREADGWVNAIGCGLLPYLHSVSVSCSVGSSRGRGDRAGGVRRNQEGENLKVGDAGVVDELRLGDTRGINRSSCRAERVRRSRARGYTNVVNLSGGLADWQTAGNPVERAEAVAEPAGAR